MKKDDKRFDDMFPNPDKVDEILDKGFQTDIVPYYLKKKPRRTPKKDLEGAVVRECLVFLRTCEQVVYIERRNTGAVQFEDGGFIRFGSKGAADIWCLIRGTVDVGGWEDAIETLEHVEIEAKRRSGGRLSQSQREFRDFCEKAGIPYLVVTSAEDLASQLQKAGLLA